jgi:hypothetical protein
VLLALCLVPGMLRAQTVPSPYHFINTKQEYGLFAGYAKHGTGRFGYGPKSGLVFGGQYAVRMKGPLAFEASGTLFRGTRDVMDPRRSAGDRKIGTSNVTIGSIDLGLRFSIVGDRTWHGIDPFIDFGLGFALPLSGVTKTDKTLPAGDQYNFQSSFKGTLGTGTRIFLSKRVSLRADARLAFWKLNTPPGFADPTLGFTNSPKSEWVAGTRLTLAALINR